MEIDLSNKCRVCLSEDEQMHYIFTEFDQGMTLSEILSNTTTFQVTQDDGLSAYTCQNCTTIVVDFYNLKTIYKENENQIKALLMSGVEESKDPTQDEDIVPQDEEAEAEELNDSDYSTIKLEVYSGSDDDQDEKGDKYSQTFVEGGLVPHVPLDDPDSIEIQEIVKYTCPYCGDCFLYRNDIENHLASTHEIVHVNCDQYRKSTKIKVKKVDTSTSCRVCHETFTTVEAYQQHLDSHKKNTCEVCGAGFMKKSYLKDHKEVHLNEKRHICTYCNKAFKRRTVLVKHRRIHTHPRQCVCEICGKAFNDRGTLKTHIMLIHVRARNFACGICGVKFPLKATLEKHVRRHQNKEKEFYCNQCPLAYKDKSSLDRHVQVKHSGTAPKAVCDLCDKQYSTSSNLLKHKRTCHGVKREVEDIVMVTEEN